MTTFLVVLTLWVASGPLAFAVMYRATHKHAPAAPEVSVLDRIAHDAFEPFFADWSAAVAADRERAR